MIPRFEVSDPAVGVVGHETDRHAAWVAAGRYADANKCVVIVCDRMAHLGQPDRYYVGGTTDDAVGARVEVASFRAHREEPCEKCGRPARSVALVMGRHARWCGCGNAGPTPIQAGRLIGGGE